MKRLLCLLTGLAVILCACGMEVDNDARLPVVGSAENFFKLMAQHEDNYRVKFSWAESDLAAAPDSSEGSRSHSSTNVQVEGIDEADMVKTDGTYLYHIAGNKVLITRAWPASTLDIVEELEFEEGFYPNNLYVDEDCLVVIGMQQAKGEIPYDDGGLRMIMPIFHQSSRVLVYDIKDKGNISLSRDVSVDGYNASSRKKGTYLYLLNSRTVGWFRHLEDGEPQLPWYKDSALGEEEIGVGYEDICYFPDAPLNDYVIFAALDLKRGKLEVDTYLGWAQNMYMSHESLYLAMTDWTDTTVFRFAVDGLNLDYVGKALVTGTPLNQFSMDEHNGYFRIATTDYSDWENRSSSLYVMDHSMQVVGRLEGIAPGEQIYSARFMGDKGYLVTFETVDPLFVIDLANPRKPEILGELKIPGFSNYLHPLDENHLLGIGHDTEVQTLEGREFPVTKGLKLAIFDVSDVNNPREKHVELIGGRGSWSEALYDHKAVFYHRGVLALPVSVTVDTSEEQWEYNLAFTGALFYQVDLETGFQELGRISHATGQDDIYYRPDVRRIVQIEDVFYTFSEWRVMAHSVQDFSKLAELELPVPDYSHLVPDIIR